MLPIFVFGQTFSYEYNTLIDYNKGVRKEHDQKGKWVFTIEDSSLVQFYEGGFLEYNVFEFKSRYVYYKNNFNETIIVTFTLGGDVMVKSQTRPNDYIIFREE